MIKEFILQNWGLLLITVAFMILLKTTVFWEKKRIKRMYVLIAFVFLLSVTVFVEFYFNDQNMLRETRLVLMAFRYSATPFVMAMILFALIRKARWFVFVPAAVFAVLNFISIFTGIVFSISDMNTLHRGPLGYMPYIAVGLYSIVLVYTLFRQCNKQAVEIIPIIFLALAFVSGLVLPFILGKDYSKIFCSTIMIALFVYYVFSIIQQTSKDSLTGLLNRQAYYTAVNDNPKDITALVSIDMNGLKAINDTGGHAAGDTALETLALCFMRAVKGKQTVYRVGGDEFVIVCRKSSKNEIRQLVERVRKNVSKTEYSCAVGYGYSPDGTIPIDELLKESDEIMYKDKARYYVNSGNKKYRD